MKYTPCQPVCASILAVWLTGCAVPSQRFDDLAESLNLSRRVVTGAGFRHVLYANDQGARPGRLHVYFEGDGTPWIGGSPAVDPTPRDPLGLRLMAMDANPAVLVGRPCYHGLHRDAGCDARLWTHERYSEAVVQSLAAVTRELAADPRGLVLIGYSGGGALAMLLAERVPGVAGVTTVAANLDTDAWTRRHDFEPLAGSINPARRPPLSRAIRQVHLAGARDDVVPPDIVKGVAARQHAARVFVEPDFDHRCCWARAWPRLLRLLDE